MLGARRRSVDGFGAVASNTPRALDAELSYCYADETVL